MHCRNSFEDSVSKKKQLRKKKTPILQQPLRSNNVAAEDILDQNISYRDRQRRGMGIDTFHTRPHLGPRNRTVRLDGYHAAVGAPHGSGKSPFRMTDLCFRIGSAPFTGIAADSRYVLPIQLYRDGTAHGTYDTSHVSLCHFLSLSVSMLHSGYCTSYCLLYMVLLIPRRIVHCTSYGLLYMVLLISRRAVHCTS